MRIGPLPEKGDEDGVVDFLVRLTRAATEHAPLWPVAVETTEVELEPCELLLEGFATDDTEMLSSVGEELCDALSFDQDSEEDGPDPW